MMGSTPKYFIVVIAAAVAAGPLSAREYRSREVTREFQREHPCPSTGKPSGGCPGYREVHALVWQARRWRSHPVSQTGDLWLLGRHRLLCGDSTVATDVKRVSPISRRGRARRRGWIHSGPPKWRMAQENHRDAQISDTGLDDLKDFAPHRLDLSNPGTECRGYGLPGARRVPDSCTMSPAPGVSHKIIALPRPCETGAVHIWAPVAVRASTAIFR